MFKKRSKYKNFLGLLKDLLACPEWLALPNRAKLAYIYIKREYRGNNNGTIVAPYKTLKMVLKSPATISNAIKTLEDRKWIETTKQGGLYQHASEYRLTFLYDKFM